MNPYLHPPACGWEYPPARLLTPEERRARLVLCDLVEHLLAGPVLDPDDTASWCAEEAALLPRGAWRDRILALGVAIDTGAAPDLGGLALAWAELEGAC